MTSDASTRRKLVRIAGDIFRGRRIMGRFWRSNAATKHGIPWSDEAEEVSPIVVEHEHHHTYEGRESDKTPEPEVSEPRSEPEKPVEPSAPAPVSVVPSSPTPPAPEPAPPTPVRPVLPDPIEQPSRRRPWVKWALAGAAGTALAAGGLGGYLLSDKGKDLMRYMSPIEWLESRGDNLP
jgi:hypothetical protein